MTVDLRTCVPGQKVRLRDGRFVRYDSKNQDTVYPHLVDGYSYTDDGYYYSCREEDEDDVDFTTPIKSSHLSYYKDLIDTLKQKAIPFNIVKSYAR